MTSNNIVWINAVKNDCNIIKKILLRQEVKSHPLQLTLEKSSRILHSQSSTGKTTPSSTPGPAAIFEPFNFTLEGLDPLTQFANEVADPLTKMATDSEIDSPVKSDVGKTFRTKEKDNWAKRKAGILSKFTTSEKISIVTSFLSEGEKVVVKAQSTAVDKVQHRLEQLDYFEEGSQRRLELSQSEYVSRIGMLNKELVNAWHSEQRVKALKIVIQCAKLLTDTEVLPFYPSKFVLTTDILDVFGKLVYERLRTKADYFKPDTHMPADLPEDFTPEMISDAAKETCLNWFYKIASIRELVPRLYVEMALIKSYKFISTSEAYEALTRLAESIAGIGNPLVAVYARCYLCRVGLKLSPPDSTYLLMNFQGFLNTYNHIFSRTVNTTLNKQHMPLSAYMSLYTPALDFVLESIVNNGPSEVLTQILDEYNNHGNSSLVLNSIMAAVKPSCVAMKSKQFLQMINQCSDNSFPLYILLRTLGLCLSLFPPAQEDRRYILSNVWNHITGFNDPHQYITCVDAWMSYVVKYFTVREVNTVFGDIISHVYSNRNYEEHYTELKLIVEKAVTNIVDFEYLLVSDNFLPLLDLFQQESIKVELCKKILACFAKEQQTCDPIVVNALIFLCTVLHDSVNALTPEDELRQIGQIMCNIIRKVSYGTNFEQQLSFYVEARGSISNIDVVTTELVQCVNRLAMKTREIVQGNHNKRTGDFVRACAAYCFITIPSITSAKVRLELYLLSGQVALSNQCVGQADACFRAILDVIPELQDDLSCKNELFITSTMKKFLSALLVIPDNPDHGILNLLKSLLNVLRKYNWEKNSISLMTIYLAVLDLLSFASQDSFPYYIEKIESNDALYGGDVKLINEINRMCSIIVKEILEYVTKNSTSRNQSYIALELFIRIIAHADLKQKATFQLAVNLWIQVVNNGLSDPRNIKIIKDFILEKGQTGNDLMLLLLNKIQ